MSQGVFQPVGQKRLTNVAMVRLKRHGMRFEIACYKNKVQDWRSGAETDIDEVLQTTDVFTNVSKGQFAKKEDLTKAFGTSESEAICREILAKGDLQVSEKERAVELDARFRDIASIILEKCINPDTSRPYTMGLIQRGLRDIHFAVDPKRNAKQQAFEAIPKLAEKFPIQRAMMRVGITVPVTCRQDLVQALIGEDERFEQEDLIGEQFKAVCLIQPGHFRAICNFVSETTGGAGRVDVVDVAAQDAAAAPPRSAPTNGAAVAPSTAGHDRTATEAVDNVTVGLHGLYVSSNNAQGGAQIPQNGAQLGTRSGYAQMAVPGATAHARQERDGAAGEVVYQRGAISGIPDQWSNRREMFQEIDKLQSGWTVELRSRGTGSTVDAVFYDPAGISAGSFAAARREALAASKR